MHKSFRPDAGVPVLRFLHPRLTTMWRVLREVDADIYYQRSSAMWTGVIAEFCRRYGKRSIYAGASDRDFELGQEQIVARARQVALSPRPARASIASWRRTPTRSKAAAATTSREAVLIPSCYELPGTTRRSRQGDRVLWVGTMHGYKRPGAVPRHRRAAARAALRHGRRPERRRRAPEAGYFEEIRARAAQLPNVEFTGFLPLAQVEPWFDRARVLVNTSVYEGMPNVFLQAWARGVPTVATVDVGAAVNTVFARCGARAPPRSRRCSPTPASGSSASARLPRLLPAQPLEHRGAGALLATDRRTDFVIRSRCSERGVLLLKPSVARPLDRGAADRRRTMSAAAKAIAAQGLARRALSLGVVKAFDQALQFLLPIVLVRCLDAHTFGEYRLLWLAIGTVMALAPFSMPGALYYFLPRSDAADAAPLRPPDDRLPRGDGARCARSCVSPLNPWMPKTLEPLAQVRRAGAGVRRAVGGLRAARLPADHRGAHPAAGLRQHLARAARALPHRRRGAWLTRRHGRHPVAAARGGAAQARAARRLHPALPRLEAAVVSGRCSAARSTTRRPSASRARRTCCAARPTSGWRRRSSRCTASPRSRSPRSSARW